MVRRLSKVLPTSGAVGLADLFCAGRGCRRYG